MRCMVEPVPLELKTGKTTFSAEHKGQVLLLVLLSAERFELDLSGLDDVA